MAKIMLKDFVKLISDKAEEISKPDCTRMQELEFLGLMAGLYECLLASFILVVGDSQEERLDLLDKYMQDMMKRLKHIVVNPKELTGENEGLAEHLQDLMSKNPNYN